MRTLTWMLSAGMLVALVGCGSVPGDPDRVPVSGYVLYQGKPLTNAEVTFVPSEGTMGVGGKGRTDGSGKFALNYLRGGDGVPPGKYRVALSRRLSPTGKEVPAGQLIHEQPAHESLPPSVSDREKTQVAVVVPDKGGTVDVNAKEPEKAGPATEKGSGTTGIAVPANPGTRPMLPPMTLPMPMPMPMPPPLPSADKLPVPGPEKGLPPPPIGKDLPPPPGLKGLP